MVGSLRVSDIMSEEILTVAEHDSLAAVEETMRVGRVHHVPVVQARKIVGMVSRSDILRAQVSVFADLSADEDVAIKENIPVRRIMTKEITCVSPDTDALIAARLLEHHDVGSLPVVEGGALIGIVTQADFVHLVIRALVDEDEQPRMAC